MNPKFALLWETKNKDDEWWSSFVTSPLAIVLNYFVVDIKWLTPNIITLLSFVMAIFSAVLIVIGGITNFTIAAILIHLSHVLDCMDGQMARYRKISSPEGSFFDRITDQIQITLWFGAVGYAAYIQSQDILPILLAFTGVAFYSLRGYVKYVAIQIEMSKDKNYLEDISKMNAADLNKRAAGYGFGFMDNFRWLLIEQKKIIHFDEGVFIFMLSAALVFDAFIPMLWVFAISQLFYGLTRAWQRGCKIGRGQRVKIEK